MTTSSAPLLKDLPLGLEIQAEGSRLLGDPIVTVESLEGGRNNRVHRLTGQSRRRYLLKRYVDQVDDGRGRLQTEWRALRFLWGNGVRAVPEPLAVVAQRGWAFYSFVEGRRIFGERITDSDLMQVLEFVQVLEELRHGLESQGIGDASEACFSGTDAACAIERRLSRLSGLAQETPFAGQLQAFLEKEFIPFFRAQVERSIRMLERCTEGFSQDLPLLMRTLSPSDFGFHNALQEEGGRIVFIDFEYFGWDDPAKMISDFILHPGMELRSEHRDRFVLKACALFGTFQDLMKRIQALYPIFGLNWCLILLNEFVPESYARRGFAHGEDLSRHELLRQQLIKSKALFERIQGGDGPFRCTD